MQKYIGLDVHAASTTFVVLSQTGKRLSRHVVETNGHALVEQLLAIPGKRHVCRNPPYDRRTASPLKLVRDRWHPVMRRHWDVTIEDGAGEWFVAESAEVDGRGCA